MTKIRVLEIFAESGNSMAPEDVRVRLRDLPVRSSVYSYLLRLHQQGLLERERDLGRVVYRISPRGRQRLDYLRTKL